jgi:hypothetical protein
MKFLRRLGIGLGIIIALCLAPVLWVEASCTAPRVASAILPVAGLANEPGYKRAEGDSYLTFPEWNIVYAYADLAGVTRQSSESAFDYLASISGFWRSLCTATVTAQSIGPVTVDQKTTNYIIALSFTAEMVIKGAYERSIGALTMASRGPERTAEDAFALRLLDDYAAFLKQTPWYQYPFGAELAGLWRETPLSGASMIRKIERRIALTLEYGAKALYAKAIGYLAGYAPADLKIKSVVAGLEDADIAADSRIVKLRDLGGGLSLIETPRYDAFSDIARGLGTRGRSFTEIAGAHRILTTIVARNDAPLDFGSARAIFSLPIQSNPGWRRIGLDSRVADLAQQIGKVEAQGAIFEHAYDY